MVKVVSFSDFIFIMGCDTKLHCCFRVQSQKSISLVVHKGQNTILFSINGIKYNVYMNLIVR